MRTPITLFIVVMLLAASCAGEGSDGEDVLRLATTTSTNDSGLLDFLLPAFEAENNARVDVVAVGTGQAIALGEAGDADEAVKAVRNLAPDVILMDIQMPGGGGFTAIEALGQDAPVVVFVTAHDRYALRAFDIAAVDYVTKPVEFARLALAMDRAKAAAAAKDRNEQIDELQSTVRNLRGALLDATRPKEDNGEHHCPDQTR